LKRLIITLGVIAFLGGVGGCAGPAAEKTLLTVDFKKDQTLRYRFLCLRYIEIDWGVKPKTSSCCKGKEDRPKVTTSSEKLDMVVAYRPVKVDEFGLTTIEAAIESVEVQRRSRKHKAGLSSDAVRSLEGKTFTFTVSANGKIKDYSQLEELIKKTGEQAFRKSGKARVKEPDMIGDFINTQWFLWDSIASIEKPAEGVSVGQSWQSKLLVPTPMVMRQARDVTYKLAEIRQSRKGKIAVIKSSYSLADTTPATWPVPYEGRFQVSGMFGFLSGYKITDLKGKGEELFNIDTGRIEKYRQQYKMTINASLRFPLGPEPVIKITQDIIMTPTKKRHRPRADDEDED